MSVLPIFFHDLYENALRPISLFDQNFGNGMHHHDLVHAPSTAPIHGGYYRPWRNMAALHSGVLNVHNDKDSFKVNLDVQQFKPEELIVKTVDDYIIVEGKHEERADEHGFITRQFQRRYKLPKDTNPEAVASQLSSDGVLTVSVPKKALPDSGKERVVTITKTNAPALKSAGEQKKPEKMES